MFNSKISLYNKILIGYVLIIFIIGVCALLFCEHLRFQEQESVVAEINETRKKMYVAHLYITKLATLGESVVTWHEIDYNKYHLQRLKTDSILHNIKSCSAFSVYSNQIDSLRMLLEKKEKHLSHIMQTVQSWSKTDSLLIKQLPVIAKQSVLQKTTTRKKKGLMGLFGKKETIQQPYNKNEVQKFNNKLASVLEMRNRQMILEMDSLRSQNKILNYNLNDFISSLETQFQQTLINRNTKIIKEQQESFNLFSIVMLVALILLIISFFIIRNDLRKEEKIKSKLKQVIDENEDLLEMRKKIILTVSHDIRGPLGNIRNCADLASDTREKKKREMYLEDIRHSCHHILHLVNDLLDAYRINEAGDLRNDTPFYLNRFLVRISDEFSRKANTKALILYSTHENSDLIVKGDADKLEQVLTNLLTNAIKFTPKGTIGFYSKYNEGKLHVEITDTGIGMDKETQNRIFAPFERAAQNINSEGFGLGLFLTKGLVKVLDGTIKVESEPGKGSIFNLEFPLPVTEELVEEEKDNENMITILPKKVLVVDDDPIQLKIAEDMLGRKGIICTTCQNVSDVVKALRQSNYDIVLTDVQMPDTDGFALLKFLRNSDVGNSRIIPVAVMTARGDGDTGLYEKEGFVGHLHKPFNIRTLLNFLSSIMSQIEQIKTEDFNISCLLENTDDNKFMLSLVIKESKKELEELESALKTDNRESMRKTIHRMIPVWEILGKDWILREFQEVLHEKKVSSEIVNKHIMKVIESLKKLINETEKIQKEYENINC